MLTVWGLLIVIIFMTLIMKKRTTPFTALVLSTVVIGLIAALVLLLLGLTLRVPYVELVPQAGDIGLNMIMARAAAHRGPVRPARAMDPAGRQG